MSDNVFIEKVNFGRYVDVYIQPEQGKLSIYDLPRIETIDEFSLLGKPSLRFTNEIAQYILDNLYRVGFRPSSTLILDRSDRDEHLTDMKKLVEKAYKVKF